MPSIDDWVAKVAQLIKSELTIEMRDDFVDDGYRCAPDFEVTTTEARIADIIAEHCPFKPGIVYMPVPRCGTCVHWDPPRNELLGSCSLTEGSDGDGCPISHPESKAFAIVGGDEYGVPVLATHSEFGCVQWKEKEDV